MSDIKVSTTYKNDLNNQRDDIKDFIDKHEQSDGGIDIESKIEEFMSAQDPDKTEFNKERFEAFIRRLLNAGSAPLKPNEGGKIDPSKAKSLIQKELLPNVDRAAEQTKSTSVDKGSLPTQSSITEEDRTLFTTDKDKVENAKTKDNTQNIKEGNVPLLFPQDKAGITDKTLLTGDAETLKSKIDSLLKTDSPVQAKFVIKEGVVSVQSPHGTLSMDASQVIGAKGDGVFLDNTRNFATQSGYRENGQNQQGDSNNNNNNNNDDEPEPSDKIYFSGE